MLNGIWKLLQLRRHCFYLMISVLDIIQKRHILRKSGIDMLSSYMSWEKHPLTDFYVGKFAGFRGSSEGREGVSGSTERSVKTPEEAQIDTRLP